MTATTFTTLLLACSGPRAGEIIAANTNYALFNFFAVTALAFTALWLNSQFGLLRWPMLALFGLLAIHPAWTISATKGDCGYSKATGATVLTCLAIAILAAHIAIPAISRWRKRA